MGTQWRRGGSKKEKKEKEKKRGGCLNPEKEVAMSIYGRKLLLKVMTEKRPSNVIDWEDEMFVG